MSDSRRHRHRGGPRARPARDRRGRRGAPHRHSASVPRSPSSSGAAPSCSPSSTAVMVNSGTSALWLAVDLLGCEPGDEVITSPLTFSSDIAPLVRNGHRPRVRRRRARHAADRRDEDRGDDRPAHQGDPHARTSWATAPTGTPSARSPIATGCSSSKTAATCSTRTSAARAPARAADISVTSFARGHSITAASNGGMIAVDDPEWFDQTLVRRRWGRHSERTCSAASRATTTASARSPTARPTTWSSCSRTRATTSSRRRSVAAYGNVQLDRLAEFNERRRQNFARLDEVLAAPRGHRGAAAHDPRGRDDVDAVPVPARRRHRPHRDAGVPARARHPDRAWCGPATSCASRGSPTSPTARPPTACPTPTG